MGFLQLNHPLHDTEDVFSRKKSFLIPLTLTLSQRERGLKRHSAIALTTNIDTVLKAVRQL
jgi:hypothetical protein